MSVDRQIFYAYHYAAAAYAAMRERLVRLYSQCSPCGDEKTDILMLPRFTRRPVDRYMLRFTFACRSDEIPLSLRGMLEMHDYLCLLDNAPTMPWYGAPQYTPESPLFHEGAHPLPAPVLFQDKTTPEDICDAIYMHFLAAGRIEYGVDARRMAIAQGVPRYVANKRYKMFCARYAGLAVT